MEVGCPGVDAPGQEDERVHLYIMSGSQDMQACAPQIQANFLDLFMGGDVDCGGMNGRVLYIINNAEDRREDKHCPLHCFDRL